MPSIDIPMVAQTDPAAAYADYAKQGPKTKENVLNDFFAKVDPSTLTKGSSASANVATFLKRINTNNPSDFNGIYYKSWAWQSWLKENFRLLWNRVNSITGYFKDAAPEDTE
jgi:hypothetical protein